MSTHHLQAGDRKTETDTIDNNENPDWKDEEFHVVVDEIEGSNLVFEVYDSDVFTQVGCTPSFISMHAW